MQEETPRPPRYPSHSTATRLPFRAERKIAQELLLHGIVGSFKLVQFDDDYKPMGWIHEEPTVKCLSTYTHLSPPHNTESSVLVAQQGRNGETEPDAGIALLKHRKTGHRETVFPFLRGS